MPAPVTAVIFDLYGTLLRIQRPLIRHGVPRILGIKHRPWIDLVRNDLLTTSHPTPADFVREVCERLAPQRTEDEERRCLELVEQEIASVTTLPGVRALLAFLKRRGYPLGVLSNLSSVHKGPVKALGLEEFFAAAAYSCDEGRTKPDSRIYLDLCARLGVRPESVLVVGDSLSNDVQAPRALGMRALHVNPRSAAEGLEAVFDLGWRDLEGGEPFRPLLPGAVPLRGRAMALREKAPVAEDDQGRYNLVATARAQPADGGGGGEVQVFCKRFLFPEAAHVEMFAHEIIGDAGLPVCDAALVERPEPCLVVSRAPGAKFQGTVDPVLAFEVARQCAAAYVFSNADLRPRNAFVAWEDGHPRVTMIDLEHCFFNLALDAGGLADPLRPETFDRLSPEELQRRLKRRVLTERTTRRAMRTFVELEHLESEVGQAFKKGWIAAYETMRQDRDRICDRMKERVYREPFLIIGTQAYRRAMAGVDVEDIRRRLAEDPDVIFPRLAAVKGGD